MLFVIQINLYTENDSTEKEKKNIGKRDDMGWLIVVIVSEDTEKKIL